MMMDKEDLPSHLETPGARTTTRPIGINKEGSLTARDLQLLDEEDRQVQKRDTLRHFIPVWVCILWFMAVDWFVQHQWTFLRSGLGDGWFHGLVLFAPAMLIAWAVKVVMFIDPIRKGSEERIEQKIETMFEDIGDTKSNVIKELHEARSKRATVRRK